MSTFGHSGTNKIEDPAQCLTKVRILVVDSSTQAADLIKSIFSQLGFTNVMVANDIYESIQIMKRVRVDMIFTDWELKSGYNARAFQKDALEKNPTVNAGQYVKNLRFASTSPNPFIPVTVFMGSSSQDDIMQARNSGAKDIVLKPIEARDFCDKITKLIDHPRMFITASTYKGPCRRTEGPGEYKGKERRTREVRVVRRGEKSINPAR